MLGTIAFVNFLAYTIHTGRLGGSAGKQDAGRFFVEAHGKHTEVTEEQWRAVKAHGTAVLITHPVGLVGVVLLMADAERWRFRKTAA